MIGQARIRNQFSRLIKGGLLSHAYIFLGPEHLGKQTLAKWAAAELLGIAVTEVDRHPDVRTVTRGYDEKNERFKRDLSVNEIRTAIQFATESSFRGGYKIIIITEADRMNTEAGNALLKMLEEPPAKTVFFLLYETLGAIMPTIRSRTQLLPLTLVSDEEMTDGLLEKNYSKDTIQEVLGVAAGRPGLAITFLEDQEKFIARKQMQTDFLQLIGASLADKFAAAESFVALSQENGGVDELVERLELWQEALRPTVFKNNGQIKIDLVTANDQLSAAIMALRHNAHPRLTVEALLAKIF